jgi:hypothetical protein
MYQVWHGPPTSASSRVKSNYQVFEDPSKNGHQTHPSIAVPTLQAQRATFSPIYTRYRLRMQTDIMER